ncbi:carbohydrate porin [Hymenobacter cheonanensis]|uniref:carbohydrate porin n=1 Tax=Hymenobacter sp. CA2-7 TaxID=3063993 RepID=UPI002713DDC6|nr:carbohydrate porin [Hymenobacter sp. CA2-7]MDO7884769.1 carbohydrate porin [Hymenobacter sp. CA2-7]
MTFYPLRALAVAGLLALAGTAYGQGAVTPPASATPGKPPAAASAQQPVHLDNGQPNDYHGWSLHFQQTIIRQWHADFSPPYSDSLSLQPRESAKMSLTTTLFLGRRLWKNAAVFLNPEVSGGSGLSSASGLGGALNGETFRVGSPEPVLYLARLYLQQRFAIGSEVVDDEDDFNQLGGPRPVRYFSITAGKICLADYFDQNSYSHDPRTQFMNWTLMSAGAWDYPANTRGYTVGGVLEYISPGFAVRAATSLLPTYANGPTLDYGYPKAHGETVEITKTYHLRGHQGTVRVLGFHNVAAMGNYYQALSSPYVDGRPNIESVRGPSHGKSGFAVNVEQELGGELGAFGRLSYNDGKNETWAFTEVDQSACLGLTTTGARWHRATDRLALAAVVNGISSGHRDYLAAGGYGFMLGDGRLNYAPEFITELYYSIDFPKYHAAITPDYQLALNPGYNRDRKGPIHVVALRLHVEF